MAGYYCRFVENFSQISKPLTQLTKKDVSFVWTLECEKIFHELRRRLTTAPVLALPSGSVGYVVYTDASLQGFGCVLTQRDHVIVYASRQLKTHEENYPQVKTEFRRPGGLLQSLKIPEWKMARLYVQEVVSLHGISLSIISDRDPRFTSRFWGSFQRALGTTLILSTAYHPDTDEQTERTIRTLEDMLRTTVMDFGPTWHDHLALLEFAYYNSYHRRIGMEPFEALDAAVVCLCFGMKLVSVKLRVHG
ncbi:uncharacterized protein [Henckelia pumila]|uniref:uncharacterized protein n=1 Tax=Henckelia pumila TaxID=405737 RepID=UPI003C6DFBE4